MRPTFKKGDKVRLTKDARRWFRDTYPGLPEFGGVGKVVTPVNRTRPIRVRFPVGGVSMDPKLLERVR